MQLVTGLGAGLVTGSVCSLYRGRFFPRRLIGIFCRAPCILGLCDVAVIKIELLSSVSLKQNRISMKVVFKTKHNKTFVTSACSVTYTKTCISRYFALSFQVNMF